MEKEIQKILNKSEYDRNAHETAWKILKKVKSPCINYGEVKKALNNLSKGLIYKNPDRYSYLLSIIKNLLEEEINKVPLTNN